jgi:hypothetical protein
MPPQFFFQLLQFIFILNGPGWTQLTDPVIDLGQFLGQAEKCAVSFHLAFRLLQFRTHRQISCLRLAADADVPQILRSVPRMILTRTSTVALAALAIVHGNGAAAEIAVTVKTATWRSTTTQPKGRSAASRSAAAIGPSLAATRAARPRRCCEASWLPASGPA